MTSAAHDYETVIPLDQAPPVAELARRAGRHERIRLVAAGVDATIMRRSIPVPAHEYVVALHAESARRATTG